MCEQILKKHSSTYPDIQFKELCKQKLDQERNMSELGKPFLSKSEEKIIIIKQKINVKMPHNTTNEKRKFGSNKKN